MQFKQTKVWKILSKCYWGTRAIVAKCYFASLIKYTIEHFLIRYFYFPDHNELQKIRDIITQARKENKKLYIQFPVLNWDVTLFQRPQQMAIGMANNNYIALYLLPPKYKRTKLKEIYKNVYISSEYHILKEVDNALISVYLNYHPEYFIKYLTKQVFNKNTVFCEYVDHIDENIWGKYLAKIMYKRFAKLNNSDYSFIVATSQMLYNEILSKMPDKEVVLIPNGVDVQHYQSQKNDNYILPDRLQNAIKENKKIIGYFGAIAPWIWNELIINLAKSRPDYLLLLIGPIYGTAEQIPDMNNIYCTGPIEYKNLPFFAKHFDVSIIPFRLGEIAKTTSPLKLFEYFAIGKPVIITSDLLECIKYDGVLHAATIAEFVDKVDEGISLSHDKNLQKKYYQYALENSWNNRCKTLIKATYN